MKKLKKFLKAIGPGFITGASGDDPSGIATYSQTGARFGYDLLWTTLLNFPFMSIIQEICGRIGMVTGRGLAGVIKKSYPRTILHIAVFLLFIANTINIGANLGAMAASAKLLVDLPYVLLLLVMTGVTLLLQIFVPYKSYTKFLKFFAFTLLAYVVAGFVTKQDWQEVALATFIPQIIWRQDYLLTIVAILGTTISPYLFFWQAGQEVEEEVVTRKLIRMGIGIPKISKWDIREMRIDTVIGMFFSQLVTFFIIITAASTLHVNGITTIETADQAARALRPIAGDFAFLLFASGVIGTGLLAVPVLAGSASYATSEAFGWKEGLYRNLNQAKGFYGIIILAVIVGLLLNFSPIEPFRMLFYSAVINGVTAPPLMILLMLISSNKEIMGRHANSTMTKILGWTITGIMTLAALALILSLFIN